LLKTYLVIMDEIDFDDLVNALREIVEVFWKWKLRHLQLNYVKN